MELSDTLPRTQVLKDGREILLRELTLSDEPRVLTFFQGLTAEHRQFLRNDVTKPEVVHKFVRDTERMILNLVAEAEGRLVASATLERSRYGWTHHVGEIRLVIDRAYQRVGLATFLLRQLVKAAPAAGIEKIIAQVPSGRVAALRALESLGFQQEAVLKRHIKDITGRKRDLIMMSNDVSHIWEAVEALNADYSPTLGE
jgi:RimJ/RimL family protein N-acetyltransferase